MGSFFENIVCQNDLKSRFSQLRHLDVFHNRVLSPTHCESLSSFGIGESPAFLLSIR